MSAPLQLRQQLLQEEQLPTGVGESLMLLLIGEVEALQARIRQIRMLARLAQLHALAQHTARIHLHEHVGRTSDPHFDGPAAG